MRGNKKDFPKDGMSRRMFLKVAGMSGFAVGSIGFPAVLRGAAPKEIQIANIHPTTGPCAYDGTSLVQAVELAVDHKNAAGGIKSMGGAKVKAHLYDTESKPKVGEAQAQKAIRDGCIAILGTYNSPVSMATTKVAERAGIPHLITVSVADEILERGFKYVFRLQPDSTGMTTHCCNYMRQLAQKFSMDLKTIAHMHISGFGTTVYTKLKKYAPEYGFEVIGDVSYGYGASDLTTEIAKIKQMNADIIVNTGYLADGILKIRTFADLKVEPKGGIIGCASGDVTQTKLITDLGRLAEYLMDTVYHHNPKSALANRVIAEYNKKYTKICYEDHAACAYNAALVLFDALERAGTTDPVKLRDAIAKTHLEEHEHMAPGGVLRFDSKGQNLGHIPTMQQVQNRKVMVVLPEKYADAKPIYPPPPWSART
jgi:branched-chain amino acid transport system substrate-binding protein